MSKENSILLAIRTLSNQGGKVLGNRWLPLVDNLRQLIAKSGFEDQESSDELLLFTYPHPFLALTSLMESLEKAKEGHGWREGHGSLPIQIVLHHVEEDDSLVPIRQPSSSEWDLLQQETVYVSRSLKRHWQEMMRGRDLPDHSFEEEGEGFYQLVFAGKATVQKVDLFPYRDLPVRGSEKECFYCGMTSHAPAHCPSKLISMKIQGLNQVGYLPFDELSGIYKKIFPDYSALSKKFLAGVKPAQLRKDKELLVFVSYFDLNCVYQLRFLFNTAFSLYFKWEDQSKTDKTNIDNRNLHMGLDCLRVGQYERAEELLTKESKRREGKHFYASVGLAFWALEQGRTKDMGHFLERAKNIASQEKERLYSHLLLSRYYEQVNDFWKAKEALNNAIRIDFDALDCQYRKMQHSVRYGFDEGDLKRLRSLMLGQKEIFMTALMDPLLLPVQGLVNDLAISHIQFERKEAFNNLGKAQAELAELAFWLDENEAVMKENQKSLAALQSQYERQTYFDLLDVAERAKGIAYGCQRIRKAKVDELKERARATDNRFKKHQAFWKTYQYKSYFKDFQLSLTKAHTMLTEARGLMGKQQGQAFRAAVRLFEQVEKLFVTLQEMHGKMVWLALFFNGVRLFVKNLIIAEMVLFFAAFLVFMVLPVALADGSFVWLNRIVSDPLVKKKSMLVIGLFLAPMLATILTLWKLNED